MSDFYAVFLRLTLVQFLESEFRLAATMLLLSMIAEGCVYSPDISNFSFSCGHRRLRLLCFLVCTLV